MVLNSFIYKRTELGSDELLIHEIFVNDAKNSQINQTKSLLNDLQGS
jgi:hypothetical protein